MNAGKKESTDTDMVAEITKRVMEQLNLNK